MIVIRFDRLAGTAWSDVAPGVIARGVDPFFDLCRLLTNAKVPDGPAVFVDERGVRCMTVGSVHGCARRYRPLPRAERLGFGL